MGGDTKNKKSKDKQSPKKEEKPSTSTAASPSGSAQSEEVKEAPPPKVKDDSKVEEEEEDDEEISLGAAVASFSSWFSSTVTSAKEKSTEMFQYLKQDFTEFSETVSEASKEFKDKLKLEENAKSAVQTVTSKASIVLDQMSTIFGVGPDDDDEALVMNSGVIDRVKGKLYTMSVDEDVFLKDPVDIKAYENWILAFDLEKKNEEMADLMASNPHLQVRYGQLVPEKVSHLVFWHRFYYHVHELYLAEEEKELERKKAKALAKAQALKDAEGKEDNADILNRNDASPTGSDPSLVDISEEDQKRLLAEYEEEMKNSSAQHSRRSSGTHMSSSSSGSFAIVTHDAATDEVKVE